MKYAVLTMLMLLSAANALLLFFRVDWINPFFCVLIATAMPAWGAMAALFTTPKDTP